MTQLTTAYVSSLLKLASDDNPRIRGPVAAHLEELGMELLPFLEEIFHAEPDLAPHAQRWWGRFIMSELKAELREWHAHHADDLLAGITLLSRAAYPHLRRDDLRRPVFQQVLRAWMEAKSYYSARELVQSLNYTLFHLEGYAPNEENFYAPESFFLHHLLASRRGSPLTLSLLYILVGQRLGIPVFGVNLPYHFVVAVMEGAPSPHPGFPPDRSFALPPPDQKVAFYVNPYRKGAVFFRHQLDDFLASMGHAPRPDYYRPCPNPRIMIRMARNLEVAYRRRGDREMEQRYRTLREVMAA